MQADLENEDDEYFLGENHDTALYTELLS